MAKNNNSDFIDIKGLLRQYTAKWYWFVISVILCVGLGVLFLTVYKRDYQVKANVLISQQKDAVSEAMGGLSELLGSDGYVEDEIFIISSHSVYRDVAKTLRLNVSHYVKHGIIGSDFVFRGYPVDVIAPSTLMDTLSYGITFKVKVNDDMTASIKAKMKRNTVASAKNVTLPYTIETPLGDFTIAATPDYPVGESVNTTIRVCGYDGAAEELDMDVHNEIASKRSNVITLAIETPVPEYGEAVLNEIITKYNERGIAQKNTQGEQTGEFLAERLDILANDLSVSEREIQRFKEEHGLVDLRLEIEYQTEKRGRLEESLLGAQTSAEILRLTADFVNNPANRYELVPSNVGSEVLQTAIREYNSMLIRRAELLGTANPDNSAVQRLDARIEQQHAYLQATLNRASEQANLSLAEVEREMAENRSRMGHIPQAELDYMDLRRQQEVRSQLYFFLLRRNEENQLLMANSIPKGQIVDEAYTLSEPLGVGKKVILLLALILGMCIPPVIMYIRRLLNNRFETRAEVERITEVPIIGEMCIDNSGRSLVVQPANNSSTAELFRLMRSNLLFVLNGANDKVVLMTSTSSGEGKSFISINLAASLALLNKRVLLVGMDIRNPQLANYLKIAPKYGLTQYLASDDIAISQLIGSVEGAPGLDVIVAGPVPPNPAELLLSPKVDELFSRLREKYDYIIVDTAPIGMVSDTFTLDRIADAAVYVCRANHTSLTDFELVNEIYENHRLKKLSVVVNGTAAKKTYGYGNKKK